jgi:hypothetical protein
MADRYWNVGDAPDALQDWVSKEVEHAIKYFWEQDKPNGWIDVDGEKICVKFCGPEKVDDPRDIYSVDVDLLAEMTEFADPYEHHGGPVSDIQLQDMRSRAAVMRKIADHATALAERCENAQLQQRKTEQ